jgi:hypothetical protein
MRIIGGPDWEDIAHWSNHFSECPVVKLDGKIVSGVSEADDVEGFIVVEVRKNGKLKLDPSGQRILTERKTGKVDIIGEAVPWA